MSPLIILFQNILPRRARSSSLLLSCLALFVLAAVGCAPATATPTAAPAAERFAGLVPAAQAFVGQLNSGDFAGAVARFDNTMKSAMPEAKLKEVWQQLAGQSGAFQAQLGTRTSESQGYRIVFVTCQFEKAVVDVQVVFNAQEQIAGLFFKPGQAPAVTPQANDPRAAIAAELVDALAKGDYAAMLARFDSSLSGQVSEAVLKQAWQQLLDQMGAFNRRSGVKTGTVQNYPVAYVTCQFVNGEMDVRFTFNAQNKVIGMHYLPPNSAEATPSAYANPDYVKAEAFREVEVTVGEGQWALPGTLSLPVGSGPFPAVVLVHGSGPNDRDETIGPNKVFRDLAGGLASQGVAVLRYEKRTKAHAAQFTPEILAKLTLKEETTEDALLAVQLLRRTPQVDPQRIYVLGHSLGAMAAPRIGQADPQLAGLILLAGNSRPLEDLLVEQYTYLFSLNGGPTDAQKKELEKIKAQVARVKDPGLSSQAAAGDLPLSVPAVYWLDLRAYDQAAVAKSLAMPILVLQGERDYQVSPTADFPGWRTALAQKANAAFKLYPKLNHLFIAGEGVPNPQEYQVAGHVSAEVVGDIAGWIKSGALGSSK